MSDLILGIDGGGTLCRAALADGTGAILGRGTSGPANILTDADGAARHIVEAARAALEQAGLGAADLFSIPVFLGLAGSTVPRAAQEIRARLPFARLALDSDGLVALEGALGPGDGSVAVIGTGTIYFIRQAGQMETVGGWGFVLGDLGGGARIGQAAMQEAILAHDGIRTPSALTSVLMAQFGGSPAAMVDFAHSARPADFAERAALVFDHAETGDSTALRVIRLSAHAIDEALDRLYAVAGPLPLCLVGGLADRYAPWIAERHRSRLRKPRGDGLAGAIALAQRHFVPGTGAAA
ncbi:BadF/BadG/BcrA/BcrD ATPase family protein [Gellertiella hungarica]|uniref:Glucosamine kinase n=1 Tax=Gellertiella hungarica TaxID=1572859 RepID=A0A7W6J185_9HYPH|nr:BadF/BadG/BcrA/BcrD ATPase family protein [Gellertiella hungarica]MBB4062914.1 glucosamine kinase [Gellertiella hungarica]